MTLGRVCVGFISLALFFGASQVLADSALITQVAFTSAPQTLDANTASAVLTTQTRSAGGVSEQVSSATVLQYTSTSATGEFSNANSSNCSGSFSSGSFTLTMATGSAKKNFCYRDSSSGTHTLTVSAQGQSWTAATQTIVISAPPDTTPPVIAAHADVTGIEATSSAGAVAAYTPPDATDDADATAPASCTPASGSTFPLGTTQVTCTKTDAAGNSATPTTFSVTVVDTIPDQFAFTDRTGVAFNSEIVSDAVTISGISASTSISVTGGEYTINGGTYTASAGTVLNGNSVTVRHTSANANDGTTDTTLSIGGISDTFTSTASVGESSGGGGGRNSRSGERAVSVPSVELVSTVEPTIAATFDAQMAGTVEARVAVLRLQALDLMYQWALAIQAELMSGDFSTLE